MNLDSPCGWVIAQNTYRPYCMWYKVSTFSNTKRRSFHIELRAWEFHFDSSSYYSLFKSTFPWIESIFWNSEFLEFDDITLFTENHQPFKQWKQPIYMYMFWLPWAEKLWGRKGLKGEINNDWKRGFTVCQLSYFTYNVHPSNWQSVGNSNSNSRPEKFSMPQAKKRIPINAINSRTIKSCIYIFFCLYYSHGCFVEWFHNGPINNWIE